MAYPEKHDIIERVQRMELYFDTVSRAMTVDRRLVREDNAVKQMLQALVQYYESGQWLEDYKTDERGELPTELKRGVLSQDGLHDLLSDVCSR